MQAPPTGQACTAVRTPPCDARTRAAEVGRGWGPDIRRLGDQAAQRAAKVGAPTGPVRGGRKKRHHRENNHRKAVVEKRHDARL
eukprot:7600959-Pyramimonas_sp.AAC.1